MDGVGVGVGIPSFCICIFSAPIHSASDGCRSPSVGASATGKHMPFMIAYPMTSSAVGGGVGSGRGVGVGEGPNKLFHQFWNKFPDPVGVGVGVSPSSSSGVGVGPDSIGVGVGSPGISVGEGVGDGPGVGVLVGAGEGVGVLVGLFVDVTVTVVPVFEAREFVVFPIDARSVLLVNEMVDCFAAFPRTRSVPRTPTP